jgi:glycosyltransferase involved in cell wall biosynthesis
VGGRKVVFVNRYFHPDQSATSQLLTDLAGALAASGLEVTVVCSRQRYDDAKARLPSRESMNGVQIHRIWTTRFGRDRLLGRAVDYVTFYGSCLPALLGLLKRGDVVVAKTDPPLISIVAMTAARLRGAELINWLQDIFPEVASLLAANPLPRSLNTVLRRCRDLSLRSARLNIVLGDRMRERLCRGGIPPERIAVIENWAELDPDEPKPPERSALRARLGLLNHFVVGYSGNLGRAHEFKTLLGAAELLRTHSDIAFLMIGGGAGMRQLMRAVEALSLPNFRFLPYQPRAALSDALAAADVHWLSLLPVLEGLIVPSKLYGILAAARPVLFIGDQGGEVAGVIVPAQAGLTVSSGNSEELARHITSLKSDDARRESMGRNAHLLYREKYTMQRALDRWAELLSPCVHVATRLKPKSPPADAASRAPSSR